MSKPTMTTNKLSEALFDLCQVWRTLQATRQCFDDAMDGSGSLAAAWGDEPPRPMVSQQELDNTRAEHEDMRAKFTHVYETVSATTDAMKPDDIIAPEGTTPEQWLATLRTNVLKVHGVFVVAGGKQCDKGDELLAAIVEQEIWSRSGMRPRMKKRRDGGEPKPLTDKQRNAIAAVADANGDRQKATRELGISRATLNGHIDAARKKAGFELYGSMIKTKPKYQAIPTDKRGQELITEDRRTE